MGTFSYNTGPCRVCGKIMTGAGFAVVVHEDMHVRNGELVYVWKWSWKGEKLPGPKLIKPDRVKEMEAQGYFQTFAQCKEAYEWTSEPLASSRLNP